ncbi:MAG: hypothetical protein ACOC90_08705 [Bacteroidota bacterium]
MAEECKGHWVVRKGVRKKLARGKRQFGSWQSQIRIWELRRKGEDEKTRRREEEKKRKVVSFE